MVKRCFVAIELPPRLTRQLVEMQDQLRALPRNVARRLRPVHAEALHVTVKFLGATEDHQVSPLIETLARTAALRGPLTLALSGLGAFPNQERPHTIFAALSQGKDDLVRLMQDIDVACAPLGFMMEERPRVPHLTLARVEGARPRGALGDWIAQHRQTDFGKLEARELVLFESVLRPEGSLYLPLARLPFAAS